MNREVHVRFRERLRGKLPWATQPPVPQLDPGKGKTKKAYLWAYRSNDLQPGPKIIVFNYQAGRSGRHAQQFLQAWRKHRDGRLVYHDDVTYKDTAGDVQIVTFTLLAGNLTPTETLPSSNAVTASAQEQMEGAVGDFTWVCNSQQTFVLETRLVDRAGNSSEPLILTFDCPAPGVNTRPYPNTGLVMAAAILLALGLGFWLLFRRQPEERLPALMSTLLLFCLLFPIRFVGLILHEGGHALDEVFQGVSIWLYVHPFDLDGFSRPGSGSILSDFLGAALAILAALLITLPFWKRRSRVLLPIVMLFPWAAATNGFYMLSLQGDWLNLIESAGVPPFVFVLLGAVLFLSGYFLMFTLFEGYHLRSLVTAGLWLKRSS